MYPFRIRSGQPTPACICLMAAAFCAVNGLLQVRGPAVRPVKTCHCRPDRSTSCCCMPVSELNTAGPPRIDCLLHLSLQGWWLLREPASASESILDPRFLAGCLCWAAGWATNLDADARLRGLRKPGQTGSVPTQLPECCKQGEPRPSHIQSCISSAFLANAGYSIPRGGMFEYVSGANFFGEIVEWFGWALAAKQLPAVAFAFFTACNIGPRAWQHHRDYRKRFGSAYPQQRRALIPWVW